MLALAEVTKPGVARVSCRWKKNPLGHGTFPEIWVNSVQYPSLVLAEVVTKPSRKGVPKALGLTATNLIARYDPPHRIDFFRSNFNLILVLFYAAVWISNAKRKTGAEYSTTFYAKIWIAVIVPVFFRFPGTILIIWWIPHRFFIIKLSLDKFCCLWPPLFIFSSGS